MKRTRITVAVLGRCQEPSAFLHCDHCFARFSATAGDYWHLPKNHVFKHCRRNMRLVVTETRFVDVDLKQAGT